MYTNMELWSEVRRRVLTGELSKRQACHEYELHWDTLQKILQHAASIRFIHACRKGTDCRVLNVSGVSDR